jgi:hypothetical protein
MACIYLLFAATGSLVGLRELPEFFQAEHLQVHRSDLEAQVSPQNALARMDCSR